MYKNLTIASVLGICAIILGAFGAHVLKEKLSVDALHSFETAVRYQIYHVIVILFLNMFTEFSKSQKNRLSMLFFIGILFFSGSIYAIHLLNVPAKSIWFVTPFGGLFFILGWGLMTYYFFKLKK
ncbi:uncharacterized membrane protein YgdD (TMEM256/DUF423 family) [Lutibacter sp. Hel_I_33_5]|uniref:DUF423 domain-containing protein n=1 Tax=Lutibacter sp. Hel_I_33_5 TaxID=1566289 RepID=UPI00119E0020|nr:DUF423 domain-containing protein [Lutibacter sp. Hel_I_33_5]TVZ55909.1 uncharacterized membrane protein YgdD (TMEM256/DUF423 family) [Lutibacter sp. Hel_I_33_5]